MKIQLGFALLAVLLSVSGAQAMDRSGLALQISDALMIQNLASDLVDWKVGDKMEFKVSLSFAPVGGGTMVKEVTKDEGKAIWMTQNIAVLGQTQKVEALINRADGKVLKLIQNGKEVDVPEDNPEVISSDFTEVTVPAGTFQAIHVIAKTKQSGQVEIWLNPKETCMDGGVKTIVPFTLGKITMELTRFKKI